ncbi:MarR family winged helix-turn-helix transcriptional regulator [Lactobacillus hominis]|uniref:MarR family winged helix-turn-helix transcriptional regulator n=1 Tax=Lactobacillus hominis TaxID=1203033 RepID=UPI0023F56C6A|nr:MarR family transcriptional regulator [Lactobacillus hominis]
MTLDVLIFNIIGDEIKRLINQKCGLNQSQTRLLLFFDANNNEILTMGDLANKLDISLSTLSRQINQKRTLELVNVTRSKTDSSKLLSLNSDGIKKVAELKKELDQISSDLLKTLNNEEKSVFSSQLMTIATNLSKSKI